MSNENNSTAAKPPLAWTPQVQYDVDVRQVGIKLDGADYERLRKIAEACGMTPTTAAKQAVLFAMEHFVPPSGGAPYHPQVVEDEE